MKSKRRQYRRQFGRFDCQKIFKQSMSVVLLTTYVNHAVGALRFDGSVFYESYQKDQIAFTTEEKFSITLDNERWIATTELVGTKPQFDQPNIWLPLAQEVGTDGRDLFYLKTMPFQGGRNVSGWVEPGFVPDMEQSPAISLLWLAFGSWQTLSGTNTAQLKPVWIVYGGRKIQAQSSVPVRYQFSEPSSIFISEMVWLADGRIQPASTDNGAEHRYPEPFSQGFTQAVYRVNDFRRIDSGMACPASFSFEMYSPITKPKTNPSLRVTSRIRGSVTNMSLSVQTTNWLPTLPGTPITVGDYRFLGLVTNWETVAYQITDHWFSRDDAALAKSLKIHMESSPYNLAYRAGVKSEGGFYGVERYVASGQPTNTINAISVGKRRFGLSQMELLRIGAALLLLCLLVLWLWRRPEKESDAN